MIIIVTPPDQPLAAQIDVMLPALLPGGPAGRGRAERQPHRGDRAHAARAAQGLGRAAAERVDHARVALGFPLRVEERASNAPLGRREDSAALLQNGRTTRVSP